MKLASVVTALGLALTIGSPVLAQTALPGQPPAATIKPPSALALKPPSAAPAAAKLGAAINVNTATEAQLDTIPQIGAKRAAAIIKNRPYRSIDELVSKKALPDAVFQKVKSHLTV